MLPHGKPELDRYVEMSGEGANIDAKGPLLWDGGVTSANLAKDLAAFANSRDGGVVVIGKAETESGGFELTGLSTEQARSFDTTTVARWINNHFDPPLSIVCHQHDYQGKRFVVITVAEFQDIPVLCIKSFQDPNDPKKHIVRERTIYVRNSNAECAPIATVDELRGLIGLATAKRRNEMLSMIDSLLKGRPLVAAPTDEDRFDREIKRIEEGLGEKYVKELEAGAWRVVIRPGKFEETRWPDSSMLESIVERRAIKIIDSFPASRTGTHVREWGICNDTYGETWTLARSGLFLCIIPYRENQMQYEGRWYPPPPVIAPSKWLEFTWSLRSIFEITAFAARLVEEYGPGEEIYFSLQAIGLAGRKLVSSTMTISWWETEECRAQRFEFTHSGGCEEFRAEWRGLCSAAMVRFVELFPSRIAGRVGPTTMMGWIEKFEKREF